MPKKDKILALNSGILTNQSFTNDDEVCIPRHSSTYSLSCMYSIQYFEIIYDASCNLILR